MLSLFRAVLVSLLLVTGLVHAQSRTDVWWDPNESGWGVNLYQQQGTITATLFIYDQMGRPTWVFGGLLQDAADATTFLGILNTTTGTPYTDPQFKPAQTVVTPVGTARVQFLDTTRATLTYVVNGATFVKNIQRVAAAAIPIAGRYEGFAGLGPFATDSTKMTITTTGNKFDLKRESFFNGTCLYTGTYSQHGTRILASGTYQCSDFKAGNWTSDLTVSEDFYLTGSITHAGSTAYRVIGMKTDTSSSGLPGIFAR